MGLMRTRQHTSRTLLCVISFMTSLRVQHGSGKELQVVSTEPQRVYVHQLNQPHPSLVACLANDC